MRGKTYRLDGAALIREVIPQEERAISEMGSPNDSSFVPIILIFLMIEIIYIEFESEKQVSDVFPLLVHGGS